MAKDSSSAVFFCVSFILVSMVIPLLPCDASNNNGDEYRKTYIVYMGSLPEESSYSPTSHHLSLLQQVIDGGDETSSLVRSYKRSFNGFSARLTEKQSEEIAQMEGVVSVFPSRTRQLHTTRSWDFMGFVESVKRNRSVENDVVIGVLDTGIWPELESFSDGGLGPPPKKWRGSCAGGVNFTCNNKIIGARFYKDKSSARDKDGHGTHTASTAAGNSVNGASFYGLAQGTARGGVPSARIAAYQVCNALGCEDAGILAAFDDAISDGVDIISASFGYAFPTNFTNDTIAIGSFHAMAKGILTVQSAGNSGPSPGFVSSTAPWIFTVAASTIDRQIIDKVVLGDGKTLMGYSVNSFESNVRKAPIPLHNGGSKKCPEADAEICLCLDSDTVKGKIVICPHDSGQIDAYKAGAVGVITKHIPEDNVSQVSVLPSLGLYSKDYELVVSYARSTQNPEAEILKSESVEDKTAPRVARFSSRGPNRIVPEILKPDITAPGVDILAAFSPLSPPSGYDFDTRSVKYNILSGTSMSCPHVSGAAAYVKSFHPDWSPAAIKSAIMTTAKPMRSTNDYEIIGEFAYGSGHVNPVQAIDPGLVYDLSKQDYIDMLCNLGYDAATIKLISGDQSAACSGNRDKSLVKSTNYPSLSVEVQSMQSFNVKINRTVTNVGSANSSYKATILSPTSKLNITVEPMVLSFKSLNEKQSFVVNIDGGNLPETVISSSLLWSDGVHDVRSPIVVSVFKSKRYI